MRWLICINEENFIIILNFDYILDNELQLTIFALKSFDYTSEFFRCWHFYIILLFSFLFFIQGSKSLQWQRAMHKQARLLRMRLPSRIQIRAESTRLRGYRRVLRTTGNLQQRRLQQLAGQLSMRLPFWFRVNERQRQLRGHRRVSTQPEHLQQWNLREYTWLVQVHLLPRIQAQS